jgi:hypothetical protein
LIFLSLSSGIYFTAKSGNENINNNQKQTIELQEELKTQKIKLEQIQKQLNYFNY